MMAEIIEVGKADLPSLSRRVKAGEVFIYPTDTVYGIGCDALNEESVGRIFEIKQRPRDNPLSVAFWDVSQLLRYVSLGDEQEALLSKKLPGPYTFIVKNKALPRVVTGGLDTIGVRVPDHGPIRELIREADTPIVTTSANISGEKTPCSIHEIPYSLLQQVGFIIDAGSCKLGRPSEVIDLATGEKLR